MKSFLGFVGILILMISCEKEKITEKEENLLLYINDANKLELSTVDDKCGEWGGNERKLIVYRENIQDHLIADYVEKVKTCGNGTETEIAKSIKGIKLNDEEKLLIIRSINELSEIKLAKEDLPFHSGILNKIMLSDSSIMINDFSSTELENFNELIEKIKNKN